VHLSLPGLPVQVPAPRVERPNVRPGAEAQQAGTLTSHSPWGQRAPTPSPAARTCRLSVAQGRPGPRRPRGAIGQTLATQKHAPLLENPPEPAAPPGPASRARRPQRPQQQQERSPAGPPIDVQAGIHCDPQCLLAVSEAGQAHRSLLFPVTTVEELLVVAHSDGSKVLTSSLTDPQEAGKLQASSTHRLLTAIFSLSAPLVFPVGWTGNPRVQVFAAPMPFAPPQAAVIRTQPQRQDAQRTRPGVYFMVLTALLGGASYEAAATAYARAATFRQSFHSVREATLAGNVLVEAARFRFGGTEMASVVRGRSFSECAPVSIEALTLKSLKAEMQLRAALLSYVNPQDQEEQQYVRDWGAAVQTFDPTDIPPDACAELPDLQHRALADVPFSHPTPILATQWKPRKPAQRCGRCAGVTHCAELFLPGPKCAGAIKAWWENATRDFERLAAGQELEPRLARTIALGQDCILPCARACVWDCRVPGQVTPLDYSQEVDQGVQLALDREELVRAMEFWPDQELRSHLRYGVRFGAELPLQLVLTPQLKSLAAAFDRTQKELRELVDRGWYALFDYLPFVPLRMHPKGATERKLEDRPRPTTDGSHPHESQHVYDTQGEPVFSINQAIKDGIYELPPPQQDGPSSGFQSYMPKWWEAYATWQHAGQLVPKEYKPTIGAVARDAAILAYPARCERLNHQPIFVFVDDFRSYFSQVPVATEDMWKSVVAGFSSPHLADGPEPRIQFVAEYRLGFGIAINSNVCQRLATFIIHYFVTELRQQEEASYANEPACVQRWLQHRRKVAAQTGRAEDTLFRAHIYTDDPLFMVIGVDRTLRALRLWRAVTQRFKLLMAIPEKRRIGTMVKWLGFLPSPMHGLIVVQKVKLLRAIAAIKTALTTGITFAKYRAMLGFLEHLRLLVDNGKRRMYGLYRPLRRGHEATEGPAAIVRVDNRMRDSLNAWVLALSTAAVAPVTYALPRVRRAPLPGSCIYISSDAAKEGTLTPAIAGYMHGLFWRFFYPLEWRLLPIVVLEFLALAVSIIVFANLIDQAPCVVLQTDSLTSAFVLTADAAKSPLLIEAHALLIRCPAYATLLSGVNAWRHSVI